MEGMECLEPTAANQIELDLGDESTPRECHPEKTHVPGQALQSQPSWPAREAWKGPP
jgi:hypothetical protein